MVNLRLLVYVGDDINFNIIFIFVYFLILNFKIGILDSNEEDIEDFEYLFNISSVEKLL